MLDLRPFAQIRDADTVRSGHALGSAMPLAREWVSPTAAPGGACVAFLHGILGRGSNWQTFAKRLCQARPEYGALLLDLRKHGDSQAIAPPHTLIATARDVRAAIDEVRGVRAVIGHSFGGKVALALLADPPPDVREVWVLDSSPGLRRARGEYDVTARVIAALRALPPAFASRAEFIDALQQRGVSQAIARWLAKNLARDGDALRFALDLDAIEALIADYDRTDLWPVTEAALQDVALRFVLAGKESAVPPEDRARLEQLARRGAIALHVLPSAGHWLHVDDPEGLLALMTRDLRA
jgi:pimeloyl-ACP methyl ester carboxylesterase